MDKDMDKEPREYTREIHIPIIGIDEGVLELTYEIIEVPKRMKLYNYDPVATPTIMYLPTQEVLALRRICNRWVCKVPLTTTLKDIRVC